MVTITKKCVICDKKVQIKVTEDQYNELKKPRNERKLIQEILPDHTLEEREMLISGICDECFDYMFE